MIIKKMDDFEQNTKSDERERERERDGGQTMTEPGMVSRKGEYD